MAQENERVRLRREQILREKLRKESESQRTRRQKLWEALNRPFVIFVLSAIVLGFISYAHKLYEDRSLAHGRRLEQVSRLKIEFMGRVDRLYRCLAEVKDLQVLLVDQEKEFGSLNRQRAATSAELTEKNNPTLVKQVVSLDDRRDELLRQMQDVKGQYRKLMEELNENELPASANSYQEYRALTLTSLSLEFDSLCKPDRHVSREPVAKVIWALKQLVNSQTRSPDQANLSRTKRDQMYNRLYNALGNCRIE